MKSPRHLSAMPLLLVAAVVIIGVAALELQRFPERLPRWLGIGLMAAALILVALLLGFLL